MNASDKKKFIKSMTTIAIFNGLGGALFLIAFFLSKKVEFLWGGIAVLLVTTLVLAWILYKIIKA